LGPLRGRGGAGLGKRRENGRGRGGREKWRLEKRRAPKLLLNQGPQSLATPSVNNSSRHTALTADKFST